MIAQYIVNNYEKAVFMTSKDIAKELKISESTVVRFASELGYNGFPELKTALQEFVKGKLTTLQRLEITKESNEEKLLAEVLNLDIGSIKQTLNEVDVGTFKKVVDCILNARKIYIVGLRTSTVIAEYMGFYLNLLRDNVIVVKRGVSDLFEQILRVEREDLVIGIGFPRYSRRTVDLLKYAKSQGATVIALTDSFISPLARIADEVLTAKNSIISFVDSLVAPLSLVNAIVVAVGTRERETITGVFEKLENIWEEYEVYLTKF
ncbi:DNA-binding MurR/RpiR family transcriptional regulator [Caldanaerobacter subterraneus subsp. tengcongensis MB4]|uniref:Transcriptional regulator n=2 Tax=Caldanaerobacter subterraneus TaxID=911092 RepID=Q8RAK1_CALS4|nr:Transcriptional regulator [Caldanaerobacter subterraneus subsp. tengcongensis MB4]MCS3916000.1 DNA-binding MurR/RpiR family transcriptional regulator [Caldanaerobacter subterraneus subsp. tengcongensis MB4]